MSRKYLGDKFDIHGGGMDLMFPHHEAEIAQSEACNHVSPAKYWLHNNMITINGQKMGKSLGNFINLQQLFSGNHALLEQGYSPMTIRFFILQSHYRSTLDFSNDALKAANKGLKKAINGLRIAKNLVYHPDTTVAINDKNNAEIQQIVKAIYEGMNDDFNTAVVVGHLFNLLKKINSVYLGQIPIASISEENFNLMRQTYITFIEEILGLSEEKPTNLEIALEVALLQYKEAKINKEYEKIDKIRQYFKKMGLVLKDMKDRVDWAYDEL
jgi:cysteinyl-tRNA synthetase